MGPFIFIEELPKAFKIVLFITLALGEKNMHGILTNLDLFRRKFYRLHHCIH